MGLKGDYDELIKDWEKQSTLVKVFLWVSFFITVSSITSLSDVVFQWKGFILKGLQFYQNNIGIYFEKISEYIGLNHGSSVIDFLNVILLVVVAPVIRGSWLNHKEGKLQATDIFFMGFGLLFWLFLVFSLKDTSILERESAEYGIYFAPIIFGILMTALQGHFWKSMGVTILAILIVLILAAINSGLQRPLSVSLNTFIFNL